MYEMSEESKRMAALVDTWCEWWKIAECHRLPLAMQLHLGEVAKKSLRWLSANPVEKAEK